jgi:hypothetical protein
MQVKGFQLPAAFVQLCEATRSGQMPDEWALKETVDAYGHTWENSGLLIDADLESISRETTQLERMFLKEDRFQQREACRDEPGFIQGFSSLSEIVQFGRSDTGEPYCFDFGGSSRQPSVVTWGDGCYWRRVAPSFESFIALFMDSAEVEPYDASEEEWAEAMPPARSMVDFMAASYAQKSPQERRDWEDEMRKGMAGQGMDDEQRRKFEELLVRLHSSVTS